MLGADFSQRRGYARFAASVDNHARSFGSEQSGYGQADAAGGTGDKGGLVSELKVHNLLMVLLGDAGWGVGF
jgi:hypothetical protein